MEEFLYLEADEEITSVIDKLKGLESKSVGLVAPKGSMIAQSLVSLKLLQKEAKRLGKQIAVVTSDEVGRNLASRVGLDVYADVKSSKPLNIDPGDDGLSKDPIEIDMREKGVDSKEKTSGPQDQGSVKPVAEEEDHAPLPKDFTLHRYDEAANESLQEPKNEMSSEPNPSDEEVVTSGVEESSEVESFVKRPVGDLSEYSRRREIEDARPVRYEEVKSANQKKKKAPKVKPYVLAVLALVVLCSLVVLVDLLFAKLTVALKVEADPIEKTVEVKAEKDRPKVDLESGTIPGFSVTKEKDVEISVDATGEKDMGEKAKGIITFKNESGVDEKLGSGTSVKSSNSVEFTLDSEVTVPKASLNSSGDKVLGQVSGAITAKDPGSQGNMNASTTYAIVGKSKITASGSTSGGITKKVKVVTKNDIERGKKELQNKNADSLINDVKSDKTKTFLDEAGNLELLDYQANKNAGDEAGKFVAKGKLRYTTLAFADSDLKEAATKQVEKTLEDEKGLVATDSDKFEPSLKENQINIGTLLLSVKVTSHVGPKIDMKKQAMSWRMKPIKTVKQIVSEVKGVEVGSIELQPRWALPIAPIINKNIKINVEYSPKSNSGS